jgi:hypothetical protein
MFVASLPTQPEITIAVRIIMKGVMIFFGDDIIMIDHAGLNTSGNLIA